MSCRRCTHISLDHLTALGSYSCNKTKHVHLPLRVHHVQHGVNHYKGTRPSHARTDRQTLVRCLCGRHTHRQLKPNKLLPAVNNDGSSIVRVAVLHLLEELEHADGSEGNPKVRPAGEVELGQQPLRLLAGDISHLRCK